MLTPGQADAEILRLRTANEELSGANAELRRTLSSVSIAHDDLRILTAATDIGTLCLDMDLRIKTFTPQIADLFDVTTADVGRAITGVGHRLDYDGIEADARRVLSDLAPIETEVCSRSGRWYVLRLRPYRTVQDRIDGIVMSFVDITARRLAEQALGRSEEQLRTLVRASSQVMYRMSRDWDEMRELAGGGFLCDTYRSDGSWLAHYIPRDDQADVRTAIQAAIDARSVFELEHRVLRLDGTIGWAVSRAIPVLDRDGDIIEWFGSASEVTARKRAEAALLDSQSRLRTLIEGVPLLLWRSDPDGRWTWASPQWLDYTGQSQAASHAMGWLEVVHPDDHAATLLAWQSAGPHGRLNVEYRVRRASDGSWRWHQTRSVPVRSAAGPILEWLGTATEIDDLKRLQGEQQVLVAELQHRTRNLLTVVRNVARRSIGPSPGRDEYDARLSALGRVLGFLSRSKAYSVPLAEIVEAELHAAGDGERDRAVVGGPPVQLPGESVQAVALALHELATNAVKYGAIAQPSAGLSVTWRLDDHGGGRRLVIDWRESGVTMPDGPPTRCGYGTELLTRALPYQLHAETTLEFTSDGVRCRIVLPDSAFTVQPEAEVA